MAIHSSALQGGHHDVGLKTHNTHMSARATLLALQAAEVTEREAKLAGGHATLGHCRPVGFGDPSRLAPGKWRGRFPCGGHCDAMMTGVCGSVGFLVTAVWAAEGREVGKGD